MRSLVRAGTVLAATGTLLMTGSGAAFAHECFIANISATGAYGAAHSGKWEAIPREALVSELPGMLAEFGATDEQVSCAIDFAEATLPEVVLIGVGPAKGTDYVIAEPMPAKNKADGKGIDHLEDVFGSLLGTCGIMPTA